MTPDTHLITLRRLMPGRALSFHEALQRAELQASRLLELTGITDGPVPESVITDQPRVVIESSYFDAASGSSEWRDGAWRIRLNSLEPDVRRRFTLAHEYKHILDAPLADSVYGRIRSDGERQPIIEQICDYFAACLLMPKMLVKRAWGEGLRDTRALADAFIVSPQAMHIRLQTIGLVERTQRHGPTQRGSTDSSGPSGRSPTRRYYRRSSLLVAGS